MIMFAAPLFTMYEVIREADSGSIDRTLMLTQSMCCLFWSIYGFVTKNNTLIIGNVAGFCLSGMQFVLVILYPRKRPSLPTMDSVHPTIKNSFDEKASAGSE